VTRIEKNVLDSEEVIRKRYYGIDTDRALGNFKISKHRMAIITLLEPILGHAKCGNWSTM